MSSFENLQVWNLAIQLAKDVYQLTSSFPKNEQFGLTDQIKRSTVSISANIAEGVGRYHVKDQKKFFYNARGSLYETQSHLHLATKIFNLEPSQADPIFQQLRNLSVKLNNFI